MKKHLLVLSLTFFGAISVFAQRTISGKVTDAGGEPLIGASVVVKGTSSGTVTDIDGSYSLSVPSDSKVLVYSYTGYESKDVELGASNTVDVILAEGAEQLSEVVVTAQGITREKKALGYAVSGVDKKEIQDRPLADVGRVLQGKIPGVSVTNFIKTAINETRKARGQEDMPAKDMLQKIREKSELLEIDRKFLSRSLNEGFSGGEKKRNEIFQMAMLEPKLAILDETDSGLDIDALRIVSHGVNQIKSKENAFIVITHYQRLLDYIVPDFVHVLSDGKIVKTGGKELALELEEKGYDWLKN